MIHIIPKPTDTQSDNSTGMVIHQLELIGEPYKILNLDETDPFTNGPENEVIWVCGIAQNEHHFDIINALSLSNRVINSPQAIVTCASKVMTSSLLEKNGVQTPRTFFTGLKSQASDYIRKHGRLVYKPAYGFDGNGIELISSPDQLGAGPYYLQEYVQNDRDYRVFVIEGEPVGAIVRKSDSLTHNIHQGGEGKAIEINEEMSLVAEKAALSVGADYCGVDLLDYDGSYTVLEVNGTPNWHCMNAPIPHLMAKYLIEQNKRI